MTIKKIKAYLKKRKTAATSLGIATKLKLNHNTVRKLVAAFRKGTNKHGVAVYAIPQGGVVKYKVT